MRQTIRYEVRGPGPIKVRVAEVRPSQNGKNGYQIWLDGRLRYYGMTFSLDEASVKILSYSRSGRVVVTELLRTAAPDKAKPFKISSRKKFWQIF